MDAYSGRSRTPIPFHPEQHSDRSRTPIPIDREQHSGASRTDISQLKAALATHKSVGKFISQPQLRRNYADKEVDHAQNPRNPAIKIRLQTVSQPDCLQLRRWPDHRIGLFKTL
jgi:hypothetical protein